jgi:hypothetical protein
MKLEANIEAVILPDSFGHLALLFQGLLDLRQSVQLQMNVSTRSSPCTGCS